MNVFCILTHPWKVIRQFACNLLAAFDDKLKDDFIYAWSLPLNPTFKRKMRLIKAAINEATVSPPYDYPQSQVFFFTHKIHEAVQVSYFFFSNVSLFKLMIYFARNALSCTVWKSVWLCQLWLCQILQRLSSRRGRMRSWMLRLVLTWTWSFQDLFTSSTCVTVIHLH